MNKSKLLFISLSAITFGLLLAISVMAWTSPSANPPTGSGAIYYSGGNVGIGTTTPTTAKLVVNGTIAASSPVNDGDVATKAYVTANAGGGGCYRKACEVHNAASCTVTSCGSGETDKGTSCLRSGGIFNSQNLVSTNYGETDYADNNGHRVYTNIIADYYVACERWCCL